MGNTKTCQRLITRVAQKAKNAVRRPLVPKAIIVAVVTVVLLSHAPTLIIILR